MELFSIRIQRTFQLVSTYIDERLYNYIGEIIPPAYYSRDFIQGCDAIKNEGDVLFYITAHRTVDNRYLYLGVLPEFKQ